MQSLAAQFLPFGGELALRVVAEQNAFLAKLLFEHLVFGAQVLEYVLRMAA